MKPVGARPSPSQLAMPGLEELIPLTKPSSCCSLAPGQEVMYLGRISGGPRYGTRGIVKAVHRRTALVDLGSAGLWRVPYHLLAAPVNAN